MGILSKNWKSININNQFIEVVEIEKKEQTFAAKKAVRIPITSKLVENGKIKDTATLTKIFKDAIARAKPASIKIDEAICALPLTHIFAGSARVDKNSKNSPQIAVEREIRRSVPLDYNNVVFSFRSLSRKGSKEAAVTFIASNREVLQSWQNFFSSIGIRINFDSKTLALYRVLPEVDRKGKLCLVDIQNQSANINIFDEGVLLYSYSRRFNVVETLASEVTKEIKTILSSLGGNLTNYKVLMISTETKANDVVSKLSKELGQEVKRIQVGAESNSVLPESIGLALRNTNKIWDEIHPLLALDTANKLKAAVTENKSTGNSAKKEANNSNEDIGKVKRQKMILLAVVIVGIAALGIALWFRANENREHQQNLESLPAHDSLATTSEDSKIEIEEQSLVDVATSTSNAATTTEKVDIREVLVLDTPTGWLNVREGPGTEYERVGRIKPGETYKLISQSNDWYKLELNSDLSGWVSGKYLNIE